MTTTKDPLVILAEVARAHGLKVADVVGPRRYTNLVAARLEVARRLHKELSLSIHVIAPILHRDHSTISVLLRGGKKKAPAAPETRYPPVPA